MFVIERREMGQTLWKKHCQMDDINTARIEMLDLDYEYALGPPLGYWTLG